MSGVDPEWSRSLPEVSLQHAVRMPRTTWSSFRKTGSEISSFFTRKACAQRSHGSDESHWRALVDMQTCLHRLEPAQGGRPPPKETCHVHKRFSRLFFGECLVVAGGPALVDESLHTSTVRPTHRTGPRYRALRERSESRPTRAGRRIRTLSCRWNNSQIPPLKCRSSGSEPAPRWPC